MAFGSDDQKQYTQQDFKRSHPRSVVEGADFFTGLSPRFFLDISAEDQMAALKRDRRKRKEQNFTILFDGTPIPVEVEHAMRWHTFDGSFPYPTIHIPCRKWESKAHTFTLFNISFDVLILARMEDVKNSPPSRSPYTCVGTRNEPFYNLPKELAITFLKVGMLWAPLDATMTPDAVIDFMGWATVAPPLPLIAFPPLRPDPPTLLRLHRTQ